MTDDTAVASRARTVAAVGVVTAAVGLAVLPMLVAFGVAIDAVARAAVGLGSLVAIGGGVKTAAVILGAARFVPRRRDGVLAASGD